MSTKGFTTNHTPPNTDPLCWLLKSLNVSVFNKYQLSGKAKSGGRTRVGGVFNMSDGWGWWLLDIEVHLLPDRSALIFF
jgi:hypothetical protein